MTPDPEAVKSALDALENLKRAGMPDGTAGALLTLSNFVKAMDKQTFVITSTSRQQAAPSAPSAAPSASRTEDLASSFHRRRAQKPTLLTALEVEALTDQARAEERSALRTKLIESSALQDAASEAALSLIEAGGPALQGQKDVYSELIKERVVSSALQVKMDDMADRHGQQMAVERSAALKLVDERTQAIESRYTAQLEAVQKRSRALSQRVAQQRTELLALQVGAI